MIQPAKVALVTGGSGGLGAETARAFAEKGARVILAARDVSKCEAVAKSIRELTGNDHVEVEELELGSFESLRAASDLSPNQPLPGPSALLLPAQQLDRFELRRRTPGRQAHDDEDAQRRAGQNAEHDRANEEWDNDASNAGVHERQ